MVKKVITEDEVLEMYWEHFVKNFAMTRTLKLLARERKTSYPATTLLQLQQIIKHAEFAKIDARNAFAATTLAKWLQSIVWVNTAQKADKAEDEDLCAVCQEEYTEATQPVTLSCKHNFHEKCINQWFKTGNDTCPYCRETVAEYSGFDPYDSDESEEDEVHDYDWHGAVAALAAEEEKKDDLEPTYLTFRYKRVADSS